MKQSSWLMEFGYPWREKYNENKKSRKIIECEQELQECPLCGGELVYESSYDNLDLYMYCKLNKCNFIGVQKDVYVDKDVDFWKE